MHVMWSTRCTVADIQQWTWLNTESGCRYVSCWNERWKPAKQCLWSVLLLAFHDMTPLTMAMKVGHSEQTDQPTSNIPSYITDIKSHYPQWKSIADVVKMKRPPSGFWGQLTKEHCSKWYHFSIINWPPGRWPCLKPRYNVTYNAW